MFLVSDPSVNCARIKATPQRASAGPADQTLPATDEEIASSLVSGKDGGSEKSSPKDVSVASTGNTERDHASSKTGLVNPSSPDSSIPSSAEQLANQNNEVLCRNMFMPVGFYSKLKTNGVNIHILIFVLKFCCELSLCVPLMIFDGQSSPPF